MSQLSFACRHCGQSFSVDHSYIAQYGGQMTSCPACGQATPIPTTDQLMAMAQSAPAGPPTMPAARAAVEQTSFDNAQYDVVFPPFGSVYRRQNRLMVTAGTVLPNICTRCGKPGNGDRLTRTLYWHEPVYSILILAGLLPYLIVSLLVRKEATIAHYLCKRHHGSRQTAMTLAIGLMILGGIGMAAGIVLGGDNILLFPLGLVVVLIGVLTFAVTRQTITPARIGGGQVQLKGVCRAFREYFPDEAEVASARAFAHSRAHAYAAQSYHS
jgi:hypothetical protein